ncbi:inositol monophosphatase, partial [Bordetella hinzii]|nr:inositol monophosphatase [Bordetella hinzii]
MSRTLTRDDLRRIMAILAEAAQVEILPRFRNLPVQAVRGKSSPRDLVTDADEGAERMISARLAKLFPGAVLIGEEATTRNPALLNMLVDADLAFLIDPIDGTRNYVAGLPLFGMMVAA